MMGKEIFPELVEKPGELKKMIKEVTESLGELYRRNKDATAAHDSIAKGFSLSFFKNCKKDRTYASTFFGHHAALYP